MASRANQALMLACQRKAGSRVMIKIPTLPSFSAVAFCTRWHATKATQMMIVHMARGASHAFGSKAFVRMATNAGNGDMLASEREACEFVIEKYVFFPAVGIVAAGTSVT
jgi:hypothetical protein